MAQKASAGSLRVPRAVGSLRSQPERALRIEGLFEIKSEIQASIFTDGSERRNTRKIWTSDFDFGSEVGDGGRRGHLFPLYRIEEELITEAARIIFRTITEEHRQRLERESKENTS